MGSYGEFIILERERDDMFGITSLTSDTGGDEPFANVTIHTFNARVGRSEVRSIFRRHGMAGGAAKFGRIGVLPGIRSCNEHNQCQNP